MQAAVPCLRRDTPSFFPRRFQAVYDMVYGGAGAVLDREAARAFVAISRTDRRQRSRGDVLRADTIVVRSLDR